MDIKQALEIYNKHVVKGITNDGYYYETVKYTEKFMWFSERESIRVMAKASEKQVAIKPIKKTVIRRICGHEYSHSLYACPSCDNKNLIEKYRRNFCPDCGQKIDWSDEK